MPDILDAELAEALGGETPNGLAYREEHLRQVHARALKRSHRRAAVGVAAACVAVASAGVAAEVFPRPVQENESGLVADGPSEVQASPWSNVVVPDDREGDLFVVPGTAYLVAEGSAGDAVWLAASADVLDDRRGCIFIRSEALFGTMQAGCFDSWRKGLDARHFRFEGDRNPEYAIVAGAVSTQARSVTVTFSDGRTTSAEAVATPSSTELRYFAVAVTTSATIASVDPVDANGQAVSPPPNLPWSTAGNCGAGCPTPVD